MRRMRLPVLALAAASFVLIGQAHAASNDTETRLRDALRNAITQLRAMEDERAVWQAKQAEGSKEAELLRQQIAELTKQLEDRPAGKTAEYEKAVAEFNRHLAEQNETIARLGETLEKWKVAYNEVVTVARTKEAERAQLANELAGIQKQAAAYKEMNGDLFKVGNEILDRYANVGISDAFSAREPFIGFKRVELQNIVQDYQDKLLDGKVTP